MVIIGYKQLLCDRLNDPNGTTKSLSGLVPTFFMKFVVFIKNCFINVLLLTFSYQSVLIVHNIYKLDNHSLADTFGDNK